MEIKVDNPDRFRIGVISDTHFGSKYCAEEELGRFFKTCMAKRVDVVIHAGDVLAGYSDKWKFDLECPSFEAQLSLAALHLGQFSNEFPVLGVTGNHDETYCRLVGADVGMELRRVGCGHFVPGCLDLRIGGWYKVRVKHPHGGRCKGLSSPIQSEVSSMLRGEMPHLLLMGHRHTYAKVRPQGVDGFECMSFEYPWSEYSRRHRNGVFVGGLVLTVRRMKSGLPMVDEFRRIYVEG